MAADHEAIRNRTLHGWAFTDHDPETLIRIRTYLQDGDPAHLGGTRYADLRTGVLDRLTATERKRFGLPPKVEQREKKQRLKKPEPEKLALLDQALADPDATVKVFDGRKNKLLLAVSAENEVTFNLNCDPAEAVAVLHQLMHMIIEAEEEVRRDLN